MSTSHQPISAALLGLGIAGTTFHTPLILSLPDLFKLVYVVDLAPAAGAQKPSDDPSFVEKFGPDTSFTSEYDQVLSDERIELVVIATPNQTHVELAKAALHAGKNVLLDKPVTTTHQEAKELGLLAKQLNRVLYAFQNRRWDSDYLTLRKMLEDGVLGDVTDFVSHYDRYRNFLKGTWKEKRVPGGGQFYSLGPHLIDQTLHCFGRPSRVTAFIENIRGTGDLGVDDDFTVILHYDRTSGRRTVLTATLRGHLLSLRKHQLRFVVRGSRGTFEKHGIDPQEDQMKNFGPAAFKRDDFAVESRDIWGTLERRARPSPPSRSSSGASSSTSSNSGEDNGSAEAKSKKYLEVPLRTAADDEIVTISIESERGAYQELYKNLYACVREHAEPAVRWEEAELTMLITDLAVQSAKEGRTISVPNAEDGEGVGEAPLAQSLENRSRPESRLSGTSA